MQPHTSRPSGTHLREPWCCRLQRIPGQPADRDLKGSCLIFSTHLEAQDDLDSDDDDSESEVEFSPVSATNSPISVIDAMPTGSENVLPRSAFCLEAGCEALPLERS